MTDSKGNLYSLALGPTLNTAGGLSQSIYFATNIAAATAGSNTVTVNFNGSTPYPDLRILEYSGIDNATPVDVTSTGTGNSGTSSTVAVTTTNPSDLLFGANVVGIITTAAGSGFTNRLISGDGNIVEHPQWSSSSRTATATLNSSQWLMQMVAFRAAGSSPPPPDTELFFRARLSDRHSCQRDSDQSELDGIYR